MIYSYIRVSTNTQSIEAQKQEIQRYCDLNNLTIDESIEIEISSRKDNRERRISELFDKLKETDILIVTELSRLGRNTGEVIMLIDSLIKKDVEVRILKQNLFIKKHEPMSKMLITILSMFSEFERDIISQRTKESLQGLKDKGVILGKPLGTIQTSKYDPDKERIVELLGLGLSYQKVVNHLGYGSVGTLHTYIKKRNLTA
jgi:DNA invertase Pin-like site-specific DNA recombinase